MAREKQSLVVVQIGTLYSVTIEFPVSWLKTSFSLPFSASLPFFFMCKIYIRTLYGFVGWT
ncbi:hypothetical protein BC941DRAFT_420040 [Chlamydoabsidia padenii]|nr:hypothetical protein BC941DRAFT_420040 [Chlamydoabsidia padenii]